MTYIENVCMVTVGINFITSVITKDLLVTLIEILTNIVILLFRDFNRSMILTDDNKITLRKKIKIVKYCIQTTALFLEKNQISYCFVRICQSLTSVSVFEAFWKCILDDKRFIIWILMSFKSVYRNWIAGVFRSVHIFNE